MKVLIVIFIIVILWYAFGRRARFMRLCQRPGLYTQEYMASTTEEQRRQKCDNRYKSFIERYPYMPIAWD